MKRINVLLLYALDTPSLYVFTVFYILAFYINTEDIQKMKENC